MRNGSSLLLRTAGVETATKLAAHEIPWTDPAVKTALMKYADMLNAGCCGAPNIMLANDWDGEADQIFQANAKNYLLIGMWMNNRAKNDYKLIEGKDYSLFQFPALGMGHDDTSSVDAKEFLVTSNGANPKAADAFLDYWTSAEAANVLAKTGYASPSSATDASLYGEAQRGGDEGGREPASFSSCLAICCRAIWSMNIGYSCKFLQNPTAANVDTVLAAIETKAGSSYRWPVPLSPQRGERRACSRAHRRGSAANSDRRPFIGGSSDKRPPLSS